MTSLADKLKSPVVAFVHDTCQSSQRKPASDNKKRQSTFESVTDDVINDLSLDSRFCDDNRLRPIPCFAEEDVQLGSLLGQGEFGAVYEVISFQCSSSSLCKSFSSFSEDESEEKQVNVLLQESANHAVLSDKYSYSSFCSDKDENDRRMARAYMKKFPFNRNGQPKYAIKRLLHDFASNIHSDAIIDMACEAQFLSRLSHPNIIRLRATVGAMGYSSFMLILERLSQTLSNQIDQWRVMVKRQKRIRYRRPWVLFSRKSLQVRQQELRNVLFRDRLRAAYHVASALRHLHSKGLLFRDVKPENVGLDDKDHWKLFDFGLCKELKPKDLVQPPDGYNTSGIVGSRRYMAPEVARNSPYGFSADSFSFAILFWEIFALQLPFRTLDAAKHYELVVVQGKRPNQLHGTLPKVLHDLMDQCWSDNALERPNFDHICLVLGGELSKLEENLPKTSTATTVSTVSVQEEASVVHLLSQTQAATSEANPSEGFWGCLARPKSV
ncbi:hypothetical protein ACA910_001830 [Epithemia clementina (nom. ined.)]